MIEELNKVLADIEIRNPIKFLCAPKFIFLVRGERIELSVRISTVERNYGHKIDGLESSFPISDVPSQEYWVDRYARDPSKLAKFVQSCLMQVLEHELNESIFLDGVRIFEPKHWGS